MTNKKDGADTKEAQKKMATKELHKIHEVVKYPDPVLARRGAPVTVFDAAGVVRFARKFGVLRAAVFWLGIAWCIPDGVMHSRTH